MMRLALVLVMAAIAIQAVELRQARDSLEQAQNDAVLSDDALTLAVGMASACERHRRDAVRGRTDSGGYVL